MSVKPQKPVLPENKDQDAQSHDRELKLSKNFEDPNLADLLPADPAAASSLLEETAAAVEELVLEFGNDAAESVVIEPFENVEATEPTLSSLVLPEACEISMPIQAGLDVTSEANQLFAIEGSAIAQAVDSTRSKMAELCLDLVANDRPFGELVDSILTILVQGCGAEAGAVLELDSKAGEYFFRASRGGGDPEKVKAFRVPCNKGIVGYVAETLEPLLIKDLEKDDRQLQAVSASTGLETKTGMAAPILIGGKLYGVVEVFNKCQGGLFTETDLETLRRGARMAAKVLEVRFLLAELARRAAA